MSKLADLLIAIYNPVRVEDLYMEFLFSVDSICNCMLYVKTISKTRHATEKQVDKIRLSIVSFDVMVL